LGRLTSYIFVDKSNTGIRLIAAFKLLKAVLLLVLGLGVAALLDKGLAYNLHHWITVLLLRQENRYLRAGLAWLTGIDRRNLRLFEIGTFCYSGLLFTEGVGLLMLKRWAEYLTAIITASFIPFEFLSDARRFSAGKTMVLFLNVAAVWYLSARLWSKSAESVVDRHPESDAYPARRSL
jgi:uncharacterized membrane protein (DUF2068 family)